MKTCPVCHRSFPTKAALAAHRATHVIVSRASRRRPRRNNVSQGVNQLALKEYWGQVTSSRLVTIDTKPTLTTLPKLATIAAVYEQYKIVSFTVHFVHATGLNKDGTYFAGVSFGNKHPTDKKGVAALSPNINRGVNNDSSITVPCQRLMGQAWLDTSHDSPGAVCVFSDQLLECWVSYRVLLSGPTNVAQESGYDNYYQTDGSSWKDSQGRAVNNATLPYDSYGELEVNAENETLFNNVWELFVKSVTSVVKLHAMYQRAVGAVHLLLNAGRYPLPQFGAPAILHLQRRPFRVNERGWERLRGGEAIEDQDRQPRTGANNT